MDYKPDQNENQEKVDDAASKQEMTQQGIASMQGEPQESVDMKELDRQRDYYEKYYEDLAAHRAKVKDPQLQEEDTQEMQRVGGILGELNKQRLDDISKNGYPK